MTTFTPTTPTVPAELNRADLAAKEGFTGTFGDFVSWLSDALTYGGTSVTEHISDRFGREVVRLTTWTAGFSSDETLLGRVHRSTRLAAHWESSSRGGVHTYEIPVTVADSTTPQCWVAPDNGVFETVGRARRVRLYDIHGDYVEMSYPEGAQLVFQEEQRDIVAPDGLLVVRPLR